MTPGEVTQAQNRQSSKLQLSLLLDKATFMAIWRVGESTSQSLCFVAMQAADSQNKQATQLQCKSENSSSSSWCQKVPLPSKLFSVGIDDVHQVPPKALLVMQTCSQLRAQWTADQQWYMQQCTELSYCSLGVLSMQGFVSS